MKKISLALLCTAAALFVSGCVKDFHTFADEITCQQSRAGRAESAFKEGKCPEKNAQGKAKTAGYCQDAKDEDTKVFTYEPFTVDQLKENCSKIIPGSSYKDK